MEQKTNQMTPNESLGVITEMINNLREDYRNNAYYFILWGWITTLASVTHYFVLLFLRRNEMYSIMGISSLVLWITFCGAAFIIQHIHQTKHEQKNSSLYERFIKALWLAAGLNIAALTAICFKLEIYPPVLILPIIGMATLIIGIIIRFKPLIAGGFIFIASAIIIAFWLYEYNLIVTAVAIILGYLVPGYMLKKSKSENHV